MTAYRLMIVALGLLVPANLVGLSALAVVWVKAGEGTR
jgi:hypothetical protein